MTANVIAMSGGKDSTATLLVALERDTPNLYPVFADTGHEHPATYEYVDYLEQRLGVSIQRVKADFSERIAKKREFIKNKWPADGVSEARVARALEVLQPTGNPFLDLCLLKGRFPGAKSRFCTDELKVLPMTEQVQLPLHKQYGSVLVWQGVRADESAKRANLTVFQHEALNIWMFRPILKWSADEVFAQHRKHGVEPNSLYKQGMGRVGCMPCIMVRKGELRQIVRRYPEEIERVREWEHLVSAASKQGVSTLLDGRNAVRYLKDDIIAIDTHGIAAQAAWSLTKHGGREVDPITEEPAPHCDSIYGLCE